MFNHAFYSKVYNALYARDYHKWQSTTHAKDICKLILEDERFNSVQSILDVGCAKGWALKNLQEHGKKVAGIDVAKRAIKFLEEQNFDCRLASAMDIPYEDNSFDVVMSSDVFEHFLPEDVDQAISESYRVASKFLIMKINTKKCGIQFAAKKWARDFGLDTLHVTVKPTEWWIEQFTKDRSSEVIYQDGETFAIKI